MLQLENKTPFAADLALLADENGVDTLYLMVKASFHIGSKWTLKDEQIKLLEADVFYGDPEVTSVKYASDYHLCKPGTDIIMNGLACAPDRQEVTQLDVKLQVASLSKTVRVFGDRQWIDGRATRPQPFKSMPLVYERSFGGCCIVDGEIESSNEWNPLGTGYSGSRSSAEMNGVLLPNLENPLDLISSPLDKPEPACFGFVAPGWKPRVDFVGTYDDQWKTERAPYLPKDFDSRFFNMAHPDLISADYLQGGEAVSISGMHPSGDLRFNLPQINLKSSVLLQDKEFNPEFNLETILLEPNQFSLNMVWRAAFSCDKKGLKVKSAKIFLRH